MWENDNVCMYLPTGGCDLGLSVFSGGLPAHSHPTKHPTTSHHLQGDVGYKLLLWNNHRLRGLWEKEGREGGREGGREEGSKEGWIERGRKGGRDRGREGNVISLFSQPHSQVTPNYGNEALHMPICMHIPVQSQ